MKHTIIAFFNNKGGVGKTSLVYHLAWMYRELGLSVLTADLDPQANLTAAFLPEERLETLWPEDNEGCAKTIFGAVEPLLKGTGDVAMSHIESIDERLNLIPGDLALSNFEDELSAQWPACLDGKERAFRVISAFWRVITAAATSSDCAVVLIDVGPNLGAINRSALIAADHVVVPLAPDLFSLQGLRNLGPTLRTWRSHWGDRVARNPASSTLQIPRGNMEPAGYVVLQHAMRLDRPVAAYERWMHRIPDVYRTAVMGTDANRNMDLSDDPNCLDLVKHYRSLMPMAQEANKPMFLLRAADGALGAHGTAARAAYGDFQRLARRIADRVGLVLPEPH